MKYLMMTIMLVASGIAAASCELNRDEDIATCQQIVALKEAMMIQQKQIEALKTQVCYTEAAIHRLVPYIAQAVVGSSKGIDYEAPELFKHENTEKCKAVLFD
jgi:hypothetical protein